MITYLLVIRNMQVGHPCLTLALCLQPREHHVAEGTDCLRGPGTGLSGDEIEVGDADPGHFHDALGAVSQRPD